MKNIKLTDAPPEYKIYHLLPYVYMGDKGKLPVDIDFKTGLSIGLYKEVIMDGGAPVYKKYYTGATSDEAGFITYSGPVVKIEYTFERDDLSLAKSCTQRFYWYDTNGNLSVCYKEIRDFFNTAESIAEAEQRRGNVIADLKIKVIGLLMYTEGISQPAAAELGRPFLAAHKADIYNYIDEANTGFSDAVGAASAETYPWLDNMTPYGVTIRQFIINGVS